MSPRTAEKTGALPPLPEKMTAPLLRSTANFIALIELWGLGFPGTLRATGWLEKLMEHSPKGSFFPYLEFLCLGLLTLYGLRERFIRTPAFAFNLAAALFGIAFISVHPNTAGIIFGSMFLIFGGISAAALHLAPYTEAEAAAMKRKAKAEQARRYKEMRETMPGFNRPTLKVLIAATLVLLLAVLSIRR